MEFDWIMIVCCSAVLAGFAIYCFVKSIVARHARLRIGINPTVNTMLEDIDPYHGELPDLSPQLVRRDVGTHLRSVSSTERNVRNDKASIDIFDQLNVTGAIKKPPVHIRAQKVVMPQEPQTHNKGIEREKSAHGPLRQTAKNAVQHPGTTQDGHLNASVNMITISALTGPENPYPGLELKKLFTVNGLRLGPAGMFDYRLPLSNSAPLFSVLNANKRRISSFNSALIDKTKTDGIALFMKLDGHDENPQLTLKYMLKLAGEVCEVLGGEVCDDLCNSVSEQTIQHYNRRIAEFSRAQLFMRA